MPRVIRVGSLLGLLFAVLPVSLPAQRALVNLSVRAEVSAAQGPLSANFTVEGTTPKAVLVRAVGPGLATFGVPRALADPVLRLHDGTGQVIATNSAWGGLPALTNAFATVGAFMLQTNSKDAALLMTLPPGTYTVTVESAIGGSGNVLLETYDTDSSGRLAYLTAGQTLSSGETLVAGFVITGTTPVQVLLRALGPALSSAGVSGAAPNPLLTLFSGPTIMASNDNWANSANAAGLATASSTAGLMPLASSSNDSAMLLVLAPGAYTAQVAASGGGGTVMLEVAQMDNRSASWVPALLVPPRTVTVGAGGSATFAAPAGGRPAPTYQWRREGVALPGATNASLTLTNVQASQAGNYTVAMTNSAGTTVSANYTLVVPTALAITTQPTSQTVMVGQTATFTVAATGSPAPNYQWYRNGAALAGATQATLTVANVQPASAGQYTVQLSNGVSQITSNAATLTVNTPGLSIVTQPASQTVTSGGNVTFSVVATGEQPLRYQWLYNGAILGGATSASLERTGVLTSLAGNYSVTVTNASGAAVTSSAAVLAVLPRPLEGVYFGSFPNGSQNAGSFALLVRSDGSGSFIGHIQPFRQALVAKAITVQADRSFRFGVNASGAALRDYTLEGRVSPDGLLTGVVTDISLSMHAAAPRTLAATANAAGFYQGGAAGTAASAYLIASGGGEAFAVTVNGTTVDSGRGIVSASGQLDIALAGGLLSGTAGGSLATFALAPTAPGSAPVAFAAAENRARADVEKLFNVSTRSQTGGGADLIAGFVIAGTTAKQVLVRAVGPTLATFGVSNPISAARLQVFRSGSSTPFAEGNDWGAASNVGAITLAAARVNAFVLPPNSRDAALLLTLEPGAYSAVVSGQGSATGISLVEVYDVSTGVPSPDDRIINIATRGVAGADDRSLIAGFVITGQVPKRVLIRGVGPALTRFGVSGVLARPQLTVRRDGAVLAQNSGWARTADSAALAMAAQQAGAFALPDGSDDAAIVLHLAPGAYSAQVAGVGTDSGVALVEVYELP